MTVKEKTLLVENLKEGNQLKETVKRDILLEETVMEMIALKWTVKGGHLKETQEVVRRRLSLLQPLYFAAP